MPKKTCEHCQRGPSRFFTCWRNLDGTRDQGWVCARCDVRIGRENLHRRLGELARELDQDDDHLYDQVMGIEADLKAGGEWKKVQA